MIVQTPSLTTSRFGQIAYEQADVITFDAGLVGLPNLTDFVVLNVQPDSPFRWLQSINNPNFSMLVALPESFIEGYLPKISEAELTPLGIEAGESAIIFVTATIPMGRPEAMTLNLAGPIVVSPETRKAKQVVLSDESYTTKHKAFPQTLDKVQTAA